MSQATDDQLALALTDWERLLQIIIDLTTSHSDCTTINALFCKRVISLNPTFFFTSTTALSINLQRLGKLRAGLMKIGIPTVTDSRMVSICEQLIQLKTASHPALTEFHFEHAVEKGELQRLKDLEQWAATRLAVNSSFPDAKCALGKLDRITGYELRQLSPHGVNSDDSTFLKALELGAKIRKGLSSGQHHFIDRIIASKIDALQTSKAITFSSTSPGESSSSPPEKAKSKNDDKTAESKEQVIILQNKVEGLEATIRTLKRDQQVMAEDKRALTRERDNLALALKPIENQKSGLRPGLSQERKAYSSLQSASQEQGSLAMDVEKLKAEMSQLSKASGTSGDMGKALGELLGKFRGEQLRLEDGIKCISDKLEHAEGANTALAMNADNLAAENAHMKAELAKSHENLAQTTISPSIHRARASVQDPTVQVLMTERTRLERELAKANGALSTIRSSLSSYPVASPTTPNASDATGRVVSQTNGVLPQTDEVARRWAFMNAREIQGTNTTIDTSKPNTNITSQAPSGDAMDYIGNTNGWCINGAALAPSTVVHATERTPSPSGSVESEL
ncbi:hypothetical protein JMJ35_010343 [Cladonia borealis]|uniref:Uncharacterized protein n=1 Tax=Cladonia borealis TaxID=184061 RepID=A0AA39QSK6_9LECA|nr:hypothetical protein JMJ35_010343 [Cladonia borealis]